MIAAGAVTVVGRPFDHIGMSEHFRSVARSFIAMGITVNIFDVYQQREQSSAYREFAGHLVENFSSKVNIFCINGDEVEPALTRLDKELPRNAVNVIYPLWELSKYPAVWADQLNRFDEVWGPSKFVCQSISSAVSVPVVHMPLAGEVPWTESYGRRYFGIPESSFVFLFFFDFSSYLERKNPFATMRALAEVSSRCPDEDICLVIKIKGGNGYSEDYQRFIEFVSGYEGRLVLIDNILTDSEMRSLLRNCDCFVSLHRAEGYGFGLINAMFLGKPTVATAYSGNLDFMRHDNSCLVSYSLCAVQDGAYPFGRDQIWAEPDIDDAVGQMIQLASNKKHAMRLGDLASRHVRTHYSFRATGLRYLYRIEEILTSTNPTDREQH